MFENIRRFVDDDRAIEGLPIRLVIALVVGVATLSVMLNMLSGVQGLGVTELDVQPSEEVLSPGEHTIELTVVEPDGAPVEAAIVIIKAGSARIDGVITATTGPDGSATLNINPRIRANQQTGTLRIDIKPPASGSYADRRANTDILIVDE
ncbi:DUF7382 domain-containing protein [Haloquadratum walsbyi]|jgi:hypothetical protein|uniref:DUF7382 domain-containing protein n=2 Tax=Haloquadratum walsbyi TaxID=293091 RepID=Q18FU8_HALWD|nr:hypothetical protein [Haloquadratum walsbyi]CAJ53157.1 uncharacterized protein HQ_3055A [Haloquadratum walsbyi DSM 16790]CCC41325.1 uncharacterized protein Hqrw_3573 [Haloquadratum walsbyi C23]